MSMRTYIRACLVAILLCLAQSSAFGIGLLTVSSSGVFDNMIPNVSPWLASNNTWSFSFTISEQPIPQYADNLGFDAPFSDFTYLLDGAPVADTAVRVRFFYGNAGGMLTIYLVDGGGGLQPPNNDPMIGFEFGNTNAQMFTGDATISPPTMLPGVYVTQNQGIFAGGIQRQSLTGVAVTIASASEFEAPEPAAATLVSSAIGLFGFMLVWRKKRQR